MKNYDFNFALISLFSFNFSIFPTIERLYSDINYNTTGFNNSALDSDYTISFPPIAGNPKIAVPNDWDIIFNNMDTASDGMYINPADTIITSLGSIKVICPFKIINTTVNEPASDIVIIKSSIPLSMWCSPTHIVLLV